MTARSLRIVVAPDSFKGSMSAATAATSIAEGWLEERPGDHVSLLPLADGGEGTLDALAAATPGAVLVAVPDVTGPLAGQRLDAAYLRMPDGAAVIELARTSGLPLLARGEPLDATTRGAGDVIRAALRDGASRVVVAVGGSGSTDGGVGLLRALGLQVLDASGRDVPEGARGLTGAGSLNTAQLHAPPAGGVTVLADVTNPLLGPRGAAQVFAPQKGAGPAEVATLEAALRNWADLCGGDPEQPGAGAAGGTAYGLAALWSAEIASGSAYVADACALGKALSEADVLITGEGCFDDTSLSGKVCGHAIRLAGEHRVLVVVIAGRLQEGAAVPDTATMLSLSDLAGSVAAALGEPAAWVKRAGSAAGRLLGGAEASGGAVSPAAGVAL